MHLRRTKTRINDEHILRREHIVHWMQWLVRHKLSSGIRLCRRWYEIGYVRRVLAHLCVCVCARCNSTLHPSQRPMTNADARKCTTKKTKDLTRREWVWVRRSALQLHRCLGQAIIYRMAEAYSIPGNIRQVEKFDAQSRGEQSQPPSHWWNGLYHFRSRGCCLRHRRFNSAWGRQSHLWNLFHTARHKHKQRSSGAYSPLRAMHFADYCWPQAQQSTSFVCGAHALPPSIVAWSASLPFGPASPASRLRRKEGELSLVARQFRRNDNRSLSPVCNTKMLNDFLATWNYYSQWLNEVLGNDQSSMKSSFDAQLKCFSCEPLTKRFCFRYFFRAMWATCIACFRLNRNSLSAGNDGWPQRKPQHTGVLCTSEWVLGSYNEHVERNMINSNMWVALSIKTEWLENWNRHTITMKIDLYGGCTSSSLLSVSFCCVAHTHTHISLFRPLPLQRHTIATTNRSNIKCVTAKCTLWNEIKSLMPFTALMSNRKLHYRLW